MLRPDGESLRRRAARSAKKTPPEMGGFAAGRLGPLSCGLYLQGLSFSNAAARSSCHQRTDNHDWQQTQVDGPDDEGGDH